MRKSIARRRKQNLNTRAIKKRRQIISIKQRMGEDKFGGVFTSDHTIDKSNFVDFCFIGKDKGKQVVYNACMTTADEGYYEAVSNYHINNAPDNGMCRDIPYNYYRSIALNIIESLNNREFTIPAWEVKKDYSYKFGIGLHIRIDKPYIEIEDIANFIEEFNIKDIRVFDHKNGTVNKNAKEIGVELKNKEQFVSFITPRTSN